LPMALQPVPLALQGTAVGTFGSFEDFGLLVGPVLISAVYATWGVNPAFLSVTLVSLAGALLAASLAYGRPKKIAEAWKSDPVDPHRPLA